MKLLTLLVITVHCIVQYCVNGLNFDDITKSDDAGSGSDAGSDNVDTVVGGEVEGEYTSMGPDSNKLCQ